MNRDVFITLGGVDYGAGLTLATGGKWTADTMTLGGLAVFNQDQSVVDGTATVLAGDITGDTISLGLMTAENLKYSVEIDRKSFQYRKLAYVAPVAAIKYLGSDTAGSSGSYSLNLPTSISVGDIVGVAVRDRTKGHEFTNALKTYIYQVVSGDSLTGVTAANIIARLVTVINADPNKIITALALTDGTDNDGIRFTGAVGTDFDLAKVDGVLKDADYVEYKSVNRVYTAGSTTAVEYNPGSGTPTQAAVAELEGSLRDGNINTQLLTNYMYSETSRVVAGATYTVYSLVFTTPHDNMLGRDDNYQQLIQIFCPSGETGANEIITVLDEIFALVNP